MAQRAGRSARGAYITYLHHKVDQEKLVETEHEGVDILSDKVEVKAHEADHTNELQYSQHTNELKRFGEIFVQLLAKRKRKLAGREVRA